MPDLTSDPRVVNLRFALRGLAEDVGEANARRIAHVELDRLAEHAKVDRDFDGRLKMEAEFQTAMRSANGSGAHV